MPDITVQLTQAGRATSEAAIRRHHVLIDRPEAKGGDDRGPMGGELFLASIGGCFCSNLYAAIRAREASVSNVRVEVTGTLEGDPPRYTGIRLTADADYDDPQLFEKLVTIAKRGCIMVNTLGPLMDFEVAIAERAA